MTATLNLVQLTDIAPEPWRNGGGRTQPLLTWPQADGWALRVSVAAIERDGGFSAFAGCTRWFAVLSGAGVELQLPRGSVQLSPDLEALHFDGADAPHCRLLASATQDLNLMIDDRHGSGGMQRASAGSRAPQAAWAALYTRDALTLQADGAAIELPAGTLLWQAGGAPDWQITDAPQSAWWLHWSPR